MKEEKLTSDRIICQQSVINFTCRLDFVKASY